MDNFNGMVFIPIVDSLCSIQDRNGEVINMTMTVQEIAKSYNEAADKGKQIGILAELNDCDKEQIRIVLRGQGITDFPQPKGRGRKPADESYKSSIIKRKVKPKATRANELILEGIQAIDEEMKPLLQQLEQYNKKKALLQQALEVEVYYE